MIDGIIDRIVEAVAPPILNVVWPWIYSAGEHIILFFLVLPLSIIDLLMTAIDVFSGTQNIHSAPGGQTGTLFDFFFGQPAISGAFWGVAAIGLALCLGFAVFAVIRSMGDMELNRPVGKVLGATMKAGLTFFMVPFLCIVAISLAGVVLTQTRAAIAGTDAAPSITGALFTSATSEEAYIHGQFGVNGTWHAYRRHVWFEEHTPHNSLWRAAEYQFFVRPGYLSGAMPVSWDRFGYIVNEFDFFRIAASPNYFVIVVVSWFMVIMLAMIMLVFLQRIFEIIILYIVAPLFVAPMPLDDGARFKNWREAFIGKVIAGFGSLITLQIYLILLPLILDPNFNIVQNPAGDVAMKALLMLGGTFAIYKSHTLISSLVSTQGAQAEQTGMGAMAGGFIMGKLASVPGRMANEHTSWGGRNRKMDKRHKESQSAIQQQTAAIKENTAKMQGGSGNKNHNLGLGLSDKLNENNAPIKKEGGEKESVLDVDFSKPAKYEGKTYTIDDFGKKEDLNRDIFKEGGVNIDIDNVKDVDYNPLAPLYRVNGENAGEAFKHGKRLEDNRKMDIFEEGGVFMDENYDPSSNVDFGKPQQYEGETYYANTKAEPETKEPVKEPAKEPAKKVTKGSPEKVEKVKVDIPESQVSKTIGKQSEKTDTTSNKAKLDD